MVKLKIKIESISSDEIYRLLLHISTAYEKPYVSRLISNGATGFHLYAELIPKTGG